LTRPFFDFLSFFASSSAAFFSFSSPFFALSALMDACFAAASALAASPLAPLGAFFWLASCFALIAAALACASSFSADFSASNAF